MSESSSERPPNVILPETHSRFRILRYRLRQELDWCLQVRLRQPVTWMLVGIGLLLRRLGARRRGLDWLMRGRRVGRSKVADKALRDILKTDSQVENDLVALFGPSADCELDRCAGRMLILKPPRLHGNEVIEKGAIIFKFTETFAPIYKQLDVHRLAHYFRIILEPSWVGYSLPEILAWIGLAPEKVIVMSPYPPDYDLIESLDSNLVPVTLGPADWVNPSRFHKLENVEKIYDAIYVANYNPKKRVDRFLRAVVNVSRRRPGYRAALICAGVGRDQHGQALLETITWAKSRASIDFLNPVNHLRLNEFFNQSKVNVLLSLREGMNKGLAEGLFAGTPALLLAESACGNHWHLNQETGRVVPDRELEDALDRFADGATGCCVDEWARESISPTESTLRLNGLLYGIESEEGREWTNDLVGKANQPEMRYLEREQEWLLEFRPELLEVFRRKSSETDRADLVRRICDGASPTGRESASKANAGREIR